MEKFPQAFVDRIHKILPAAEWDDFFVQATEPLPKVIRRADLDAVVPANWQLSPTLIPEAFFIDRSDQAARPLGKTLEHFTGQIYSQSLSSMLPVDLLDPKPGEVVLDMCAAPGSKTTFMAQRMEDTGLIVANEPSGSRSKKLVANLNRLGVSNTVVLQSDGTLLDQFIDPIFDKVLLDAPCSSEGFGRREAKFFENMWSEGSIVEMSKLQKRLITAAFNLLRVDGTMTYSTCTSAPEENEVIVQHLLDTFPGAVEILPIACSELPKSAGLESWQGQAFDPLLTERVVRLYPHLRSAGWNSESFFVCLIRKVAPVPPIERAVHNKQNNHNFLKKNAQQEISTRLRKAFGLPKNWLGEACLLEKNGDIYLLPKVAKSFCNHYLWRRAGLKILDADGNLTTAFALRFGNLGTENVMSFSTDEMKRWLAGYDLPIEAGFSGQVLVNHQGHCLGWGKVIDKKLKNKLDRDLVFDY